MPDGDCQDGLWGQVAVWPPKPCPGGLGARSASALSPLVAAGSHGPYGTHGGAASHSTVSCNTSPGRRLVWYRPGHKPGKGLVHSSSRRPEVTGEADSGWALPCLPFGILSTLPVGPAYGLNSSKATRTARPARALCGTRPLTQRHCRWPALGREHGIAPQEAHIMPDLHLSANQRRWATARPERDLFACAVKGLSGFSLRSALSGWFVRVGNGP
jgi:hypothetical protein